MAYIEFTGKRDVYSHDLGVPIRSLKHDKTKSFGKSDADGNLIIHGDNLHALKALMPRYEGKVNLVYIDPPYNTGNSSWIYNDAVDSPTINNWRKKTVDGEDGLRHDKWLCMMWPRLQLLKSLLADDGAIFVSIDDNEQHRLRAIMDEIFGEENFRNSIIVGRGTKNLQKQFMDVERLNWGHEFILFYSRNPSVRFSNFSIQREDERESGWNNHWRGTDRPTMRYEILGKNITRGQWRWSKNRSLKAIENYKRMLEELGKPEEDITQEEIDDWYMLQNDRTVDMLRLSAAGKPVHYIPPSWEKYPNSLWDDLPVNANRQLKNIFPESNMAFPYPKSTNLLRRIIQFATSNNKNALVLDSFAGSGTTAHAVLEANKEDGGSRRFILAECENYADKITAERVRRVIKGIPNAKEGSSLHQGTGGSFTYAALGRGMDPESLINAKSKGRLPKYNELAAYVFWTATGQRLDNPPDEPRDDWFIGATDRHRIHLIYKRDLRFLRSNDAALNSELAKTIGGKGKTRAVFAPLSYMNGRDLLKSNIRFCQLPWALQGAKLE